MPMERRDRSVSIDRCGTYPYLSSFSHEGKCLPTTCAETEENFKEWEEARCPVCMEPPHNAVLLICSSHEKGCRPYMCDTSYRHSNCLDQFCKSFAETSSTMAHQENLPSMTQSSSAVGPEVTASFQDGRNENGTAQTSRCENPVLPKLACPLCRGKIKEWVVIEPARRFMNAKLRSCARETCNFSGNYSDLRKHARLEHPLARPSDADPERQRNWERMEHQRDLEDFLSTLQSFGEGSSEFSIFSPFEDGGWLSIYFLFQFFQPRRSGSRGTRPSRLSSRRPQHGIHRRSRRHPEMYDRETRSLRERHGESSDGIPGWRHSGRRRPREEDSESSDGIPGWRRWVRRRMS